MLEGEDKNINNSPDDGVIVSDSRVTKDLTKKIYEVDNRLKNFIK